MFSIAFPIVRTGTGAELFFRRLCKALNSRGITANLIELSQPAELAPCLYRIKSKTDIIHTNSWQGAISYPKDSRLVITDHCACYDLSSTTHLPLHRRIYRKLIKQNVLKAIDSAARITTISEWSASKLREQFPGHSWLVINNWVDDGVFTPSPSNHSERLHILFPAIPTTTKGAHHLPPLLEALPGNITLSIPASCSHRRLWKRYLGRHFEFINFIPRAESDYEMAALYQRSDMVLILSELETASLVAIEAMACGRPVVALRRAALPETIGDYESGGAGLLCSDLSEVAYWITTLINDRSLLDSISHAGVERVKSLFNEKVIMEQYVLLYQQLVTLR